MTKIGAGESPRHTAKTALPRPRKRAGEIRQSVGRERCTSWRWIQGASLGSCATPGPHRAPQEAGV